MGSPRLLLAFTFGTAVVVGVVVALIVGSWWVLAIAVAVHLTTTAVLVNTIFKSTEQGDKPDPITEARIDERKTA
jgi:membrane protein implicated in regulation of membrane protease activity